MLPIISVLLGRDESNPNTRPQNRSPIQTIELRNLRIVQNTNVFKIEESAGAGPIWSKRLPEFAIPCPPKRDKGWLFWQPMRAKRERSIFMARIMDCAGHQRHEFQLVPRIWRSAATDGHQAG